jgi:hypothetical protein
MGAAEEEAAVLAVLEDELIGLVVVEVEVGDVVRESVNLLLVVVVVGESFVVVVVDVGEESCCGRRRVVLVRWTFSEFRFWLGVGDGVLWLL